MHKKQDIVDSNDEKPVNLDRYTETKSISILSTKIKFISTKRWKQVNFDLHSNIKSTSMPCHQSRVNSDPGTKYKLFSTDTQNQVNSDPCTKINATSIPNTETTSSSTTHIQTNSILMLTRKNK